MYRGSRNLLPGHFISRPSFFSRSAPTTSESWPFFTRNFHLIENNIWAIIDRCPSKQFSFNVLPENPCWSWLTTKPLRRPFSRQWLNTFFINSSLSSLWGRSLLNIISIVPYVSLLRKMFSFTRSKAGFFIVVTKRYVHEWYHFLAFVQLLYVLY